MMFEFCAVFLFSSIAQANPLGGNIEGRTGGNTQCTPTYDIVHEEKCHHEEVCHEEYDVVVTTTVKNMRTSSPSIATMNTKMFTTPPMLLAMTPQLLDMKLDTAMNTAITSVMLKLLILILEVPLTPVDQSVRNMLRRNAIRSQSRTPTRFPTRSVTVSPTATP